MHNCVTVLKFSYSKIIINVLYRHIPSVASFGLGTKFLCLFIYYIYTLSPFCVLSRYRVMSHEQSHHIYILTLLSLEPGMHQFYQNNFLNNRKAKPKHKMLAY